MVFAVLPDLPPRRAPHGTFLPGGAPSLFNFGGGLHFNSGINIFSRPDAAPPDALSDVRQRNASPGRVFFCEIAGPAPGDDCVERGGMGDVLAVYSANYITCTIDILFSVSVSSV